MGTQGFLSCVKKPPNDYHLITPLKSHFHLLSFPKKSLTGERLKPRVFQDEALNLGLPELSLRTAKLRLLLGSWG